MLRALGWIWDCGVQVERVVGGRVACKEAKQGWWVQLIPLLFVRAACMSCHHDVASLPYKDVGVASANQSAWFAILSDH